MPVVDKLYPEVRAGGYSRVDGSVEFYGRINALVTRHSVVLDFGAGRGKDVTDDPVPYRRSLRALKGKVAEVIGADVDPVVLSNAGVDRAMVIEEHGLIPLPDHSVDVIVSDFCFEHVRSPSHVAKELTRILKPGGWLCARTPNRWGYIGLAANTVPNRFHTALLRRLQPTRKPGDVFPTRYLLNTKRQIRSYFPASTYIDCSYMYDSEPAYFGNSLPITRAARLLLDRAPEALSALLYIFLQKRPHSPPSPAPFDNVSGQHIVR